MLRLSIAVAFWATSACVLGQSTVDEVLQSIESNNITLRSMQEYTSAQKAQYQVGLNPKNPQINSNYVVSDPSSNASELTVQATQQFKFPTVYSRQRDLANDRSEAADMRFRTSRQQVLLDAKLTYIRLAYQYRNKELLSSRTDLADSLLAAYQKQLDAGAISQVEMNKARIYALNIKNMLADAETGIKSLEQKLAGLNGNKPLDISGVDFPEVTDEFVLDSLESEVASMDPTLLALEEQIDSYESQIALNKALKLPNFGAGYSFRQENGITFNGVNFMVTLPLWQNKNLVESSQANLIYGRTALEERKVNRLTDLRQYVEQYRVKRDQLELFTEALSTVQSREILERSLELGEIDIIEFVREEEYLFRLHRQYLETRMQYHVIVANMLKHRL